MGGNNGEMSAGTFYGTREHKFLNVKSEESQFPQKQLHIIHCEVTNRPRCALWSKIFGKRGT